MCFCFSLLSIFLLFLFFPLYRDDDKVEKVEVSWKLSAGCCWCLWDVWLWGDRAKVHTNVIPIWGFCLPFLLLFLARFGVRENASTTIFPHFSRLCLLLNCGNEFLLLRFSSSRIVEYYYLTLFPPPSREHFVNDRNCRKIRCRLKINFNFHSIIQFGSEGLQRSGWMC